MRPRGLELRLKSRRYLPAVCAALVGLKYPFPSPPLLAFICCFLFVELFCEMSSSSSLAAPALLLRSSSAVIRSRVRDRSIGGGLDAAVISESEAVCIDFEFVGKYEPFGLLPEAEEGAGEGDVTCGVEGIGISELVMAEVVLSLVSWSGSEDCGRLEAESKSEEIVDE